MKEIKIGVLGSAFNMPTLGHADVVEQSLKYFDEIWLVPSFAHGFGKKMMDYAFRVDLTMAFAEDLRKKLGGDVVKGMPIEATLAANRTPVYTFDVLEHLEKINESYLLGNGKFEFIIGPDNLDSWHKFYKSKEIDEKWGKFVAEQSKEIRSTMVRNAMMNGEDISPFVTESVYKLMMENKAELEKLYL